jgi:L,D-transpeptidase catalytic domain
MPSGTFAPTSMNEVWYSKQWDNSPMPHSIFFMKDGHAIHGSHEVKNLGKPVSHGCVRISPENAAVLYDLVNTNGMENTKVVLAGITPGDESNVPEDQPYYPRNGEAYGDSGIRLCTHKSRSVSSGWSMSALPPKTDIRQRIEHVCLVP